MQSLLNIGSWRAKSICVVALLLRIFMMAPLSEAGEGKRVAFVVGIGTYKKLPPHQQLKNAVNDAEGVAERLRAVGYQVIQDSNLTRSDFYDKWQDVLQHLTAEDTFVMFFSGHGVQIHGKNYLLPSDIEYIKYGRDEQLKEDSISVQRLVENVTDGPHPRYTVMILDACRENPFIPPEYKGVNKVSGLAKTSIRPGLVMIYSALDNSPSLDRLGSDDTSKYSVFTRVLIPLLGRHDLTIQDLVSKLKKEVKTLAESAGFFQLPAVYDGTDGNPFCLPGCNGTTDKGTKLNEVLSLTRLPRELIGKDGAPMVLIPEGEFWMGSPRGEGDRHEHPRHRVRLSSFYLDKYEVTNRRFEQFIRETGYETTAEQEGSAWVISEYDYVRGAYWMKPEGHDTVFATERSEHPVVSVSWDDAQAYCRWAGKRLPTEAEFEYATRAGTDTKYWWGDGHPGARFVANIADKSFERQFPGEKIVTAYDDGYGRTSPVGSFEANPFGLHDMIGNVFEWTADWYDKNYYSKSSDLNPKGPASGDFRVFRGGGWTLDLPMVRSAARYASSPMHRSDDTGFRCAQDIAK